VLFAANQERNSSIGCTVGFRAAIAGGKPYLIDRTELLGIVLAAGDSPDVAAPHSFSRSDTASMNA